ncbi:WYL domain-containing protein [Photobacterium atrarenae]|uniref:WYL domain-containing protein n=1 Tax=Photobacterium atrarenae TaxID=865757 RepID=A0ABY5GB42_9GAMM|nr:WYL domain-containing protein [Photobacterium atrarenae]UTV26371.1 WYL domain-containing protein [Photobacterium atrarenae]
MNKYLRLTLYICATFFISFITLGIATQTMSAIPGSLTWVVVTGLCGCALFKRWRKFHPKTPSSPKQEWQGWEPVTRESPTQKQTPTKQKRFTPWYEEDLLWQGKRKLQITYHSEKDEVTERRIEMVGCWPNENGEIFIRAKCDLRDDWRTFKADNILHLKTARNKSFDNFSDYMSSELGI